MAFAVETNLFLNRAHSSAATTCFSNGLVRRLNVVEANDGINICGGISNIGGMFCRRHCYIMIIAMSGMFIVLGSLLTAMGYRPQAFGEMMHAFVSRQVCIFRWVFFANSVSKYEKNC